MLGGLIVSLLLVIDLRMEGAQIFDVLLLPSLADSWVDAISISSKWVTPFGSHETNIEVQLKFTCTIH